MKNMCVCVCINGNSSDLPVCMVAVLAGATKVHSCHGRTPRRERTYVSTVLLHQGKQNLRSFGTAHSHSILWNCRYILDKEREHQRERDEGRIVVTETLEEHVTVSSTVKQLGNSARRKGKNKPRLEKGAGAAGGRKTGLTASVSLLPFMSGRQRAVYRIQFTWESLIGEELYAR